MSSFLTSVAALAFLAVLPASAAAEEQQVDEALIPVPTEMCRTYFFVPMTLSGGEEGSADRTLNFLFDTGASYTIVDPDSVERVSGTRVEVSKRAIFRNATMGPVKVNRMAARVIELDHLSTGLGREIDGILPYDAFGDYLVTLDYEAGEILVSEGKLPRPDGKTVFSTRGKDSRPWIELDIDGKKRRILIDSGATTALGLRDIDNYDFAAPPKEVSTAARLKRIEVRRGGRLSGDVKMGPHTIQMPIVYELPGTEIMGGKMLRHFELTLDQRRKRVKITRKTGTSDITVDPERSLGVMTKPSKEGLTVYRLIPGAAQADDPLAEGDLITHIGGRPVRSRGCDPIAASDGVALTVVRGDVARDLVQPVSVVIE